MSDNRAAILGKIVAGDILYAKTNNGTSLICLVTRTDRDYIEARTVTNQNCVQIDRSTGLGKIGAESVDCFVDSAAPLPTAVYNEILGLDRKFRLAQTEFDFKLTNSEKKALLFIDLFYSKRPL